MANCYNLISCNETVYPSIYHVGGSTPTEEAALLSNVGNLIEITGGEFPYKVVKSKQALYVQPDGYEIIGNPIGNFQTGSLGDITWEVASFVVNGVEKIPVSVFSTPLIPADVDFINCTDEVCVVAADYATGNNFSNYVDFLNSVFAAAGVDPSIMAFNATVGGFDRYGISHNEGDTFDLEVNRIDNLNSNYHFRMLAGGILEFEINSVLNSYGSLEEDLCTAMNLVSGVVLSSVADCESLVIPFDCQNLRTHSYAIRVKLPETTEVIDRGFKKCGYKNMVLADISSSDYEKNDFNSFYYKRQLNSDSCDFILHDVRANTDYPLVDSTYGELWGFGGFQTQEDLTVYRVDWKKVLEEIGEGEYLIRKEITVVGITGVESSNTFCLMQFSTDLADKTVRIDSVQNGNMKHIGIDFSGTDFITSQRVRGFFGRREPKFTEDIIVYTDETHEQVSLDQDNEFLFQTGLIPECITELFFDFLLFGYPMYMNDYNSNNHSYSYKKASVKLKENSGTDYYSLIREARLNITFEDRIKNKRKTNC